MKPIYLPIRSFGDFIITASVIKNNFAGKVPVILPSYLKDIYQAIDGDDLFRILDNFQLSNQPAFFELYKVRDLKNVKRLIADIRTISVLLNINKKDHYLLDYSSKRLFFTGAKFVWPSSNKNIYEAKFDLLKEQGFIMTDHKAVNVIMPVDPVKRNRVLILPDSRIHAKSINSALTELLVRSVSGEIGVAEFSTANDTKNKHLSYSNFYELIALMSSFDLVISAESLPYHLANYLNRPHFVIYNRSRHFKSAFMTPFMIKNKYFATFTGDNSAEITDEINRILTKNN